MASRRTGTAAGPPKADASTSAAWQPPTIADYEKLGSFYLGRPYDLEEKAPKPGILLYDSRDLLTHAVCVGMTGSGKTGLCIALLEEAVMDGLPAIAIDPKGDLTNLMLTFPELAPSDFRPWVDEDDAKRRNVPIDQYAAEQADTWRRGLASWGEDGERIRKLRESADFAIYTPGSTAGIPVSILASFAAPAQAIRDDPELMQERVSTTATSLLGLLGIDADPVRSREHILLSSLFTAAWTSGASLDLPSLIQQIQAPPMARIGVLDLESFYPGKERFSLAMAMNNLLAAPGFSTWLEGQPLDIGSVLRMPDGKPRVAIFSIAHLSDAERMFFVSLLLNQVLSWTHSQSGTTSLRAVLYMDEIFGYFPPVADPPSKRPLLTLLKQARAFGLGIVLATQNPVDLDYKGLANTGTWFLGRLQTERDKVRVLEGLEGAAASANSTFDRQKTGEALAGLGSRVFLMNNVHAEAMEVFESRWAMSYLRGPLTRDQIKVLMQGHKAPNDASTPLTAAPTPSAVPTAPTTSSAPAAPAPRSPAGAADAQGGRPLLPPEVPQWFIPLRGASGGSTLLYVPMLLGSASVRFADAKTGVEATETRTYIAPLTGDAGGVAWDSGIRTELAVADLEKEPEVPAEFTPVPASAARARSYTQYKTSLATWLFRNATLDLEHAGREQRDRAVDALRAKYAPRAQRLDERIRNAAQIVDREAGQERSAQMQTAISVGATVLGALLGSGRSRVTSIGRATTAARGVGRALDQRQDVARAKEDLTAARAELDALNAEVEQKVTQIGSVGIRPRKSDIDVQLVALAWAPYRKDPQGTRTPAWE
ncbi:MAG: ATP-binding protein [Candidatus Limnocylindria bacterium]